LAKTNQFNAAKPLAHAAINIFSESNYINSEIGIKSLLNIGFIYNFLNNTDSAEYFLKLGTNIAEKSFGSQSTIYLQGLSNLCIVLKNTGQLKEAEKRFKECLLVSEKIYGKENISYVNLLSNYSNLLITLEDFQNVEKYKLEALSISKRIKGDKSYDAAINNFQLGYFYKLIGQYDLAINYYQEAKSIFEEKEETKDPYYARTLNNLVNIYSAYNRIDSIILYYEKIKKLLETNSDTKLLELLIADENIGRQLFLKGKKEEGLKKMIEVRNSRMSIKKVTSDGCEGLMLASSYFELGEYKKAELLALDCINELNNYPNFAEKMIAVEMLTLIYEKNKEYSKSDSFFRINYYQTIAQLEKGLTYLSQNEFESLVSHINSFYEKIMNALYQRQEKNDDLMKLAYNGYLLYNGLLLNSYLSKKIKINQDSLLKSNHTKAQIINKNINKLKLELPTNLEKLKSLENDFNFFEKEIARSISEKGETFILPTNEIIESKLHPDEILIEFNHFSNSLNRDSIIYGAFIIESGKKAPKWIPLSTNHELEKIIGVSLEPKDSRLLTYTFSGLKSIYSVLLKPILDSIESNKKIFYTVSGLLHKINLQAAPIEQNKIIDDVYPMQRLFTSYELTKRIDNKIQQYSQVDLFGDIDFNYTNPNIAAITNNSNVANRSSEELLIDSIIQNSVWLPIHSSKKELEEIQTSLKKENIKYKILSSSSATEDLVKNSYNGKNASPSILHFATHAFFFNDKKKFESNLVYTKSDDPMIRSGLILANANYAWINNKVPEGESEDGVLTSLEVCELDLCNTQLVVLSACETGLGDISSFNYEGVYGLQRAFKIAGAKSILMSLWKISDKETSELMNYFYKYLIIEKKSKSESLRLSQLEMRNKGAKPFYWAGFILVQ
jgi:CHAT domain-containing protein